MSSLGNSGYNTAMNQSTLWPVLPSAQAASSSTTSPKMSSLGNFGPNAMNPIDLQLDLSLLSSTTSSKMSSLGNFGPNAMNPIDLQLYLSLLSPPPTFSSPIGSHSQKSFPLLTSTLHNPVSDFGPTITQEKIMEALKLLFQDEQIINDIYRVLQNARTPR